MQEKNQLKTANGFILALLSGCSFGSLAIFFQLGLDQGLDRLCLLAWRFLLSSVILLPLAFGAIRKHRQRFLLCLLVGAIGFTAEAAIFTAAIPRIGAGMSAILLYLYPAYVTLTSALFFKEKLSRRLIVSLLLSLLGCILVCLTPVKSYDLVGLLLGLASALVYGTYLIVSSRVLKGIPASAVTAIVSFGCSLTFFCWSTATGVWKIPGNIAEWRNILALAVFGTILPILTLFKAIPLIGVAKVSLISTIEPVMTVFLGWVVLEQALTPMQLIGGALILTSVVLIHWD